jgi:hypothetical protein
MRLTQFLTEQQLSDVHDALDVAKLSLPYTYMMPEINNSNFYDIYRFGVALAAVRGEQGDDGTHARSGKTPEFRAATKWGPNLIVSSFDPDVGNVIDKALKKVNKHGRKTVSTSGSEEMKDTYSGSPIKPFKGYPK